MKAIVYQVSPAAWMACKALGAFWPQCVLSPLGGLSLRRLPMPDLPGEQWVRLRTLMGGVCGTDVSIVSLKQPPNSILQAYSSMPMVMGHENVAVVEEVGAAVDRSWIGRRVCVDPTLSCGAREIEPPCPRCREGEFGVCENFAGGKGDKIPAGTSIGYNSRTGGSFGEFFVAHASQLVPVPDGISDELALLTDPVACGLHAVLRTDLTVVQHLLIYGAGTMGLAVIASLRATGYSGRIDVLDRAAYMGKLATAMGADEFLQPPSDSRGRFETIAKAVNGTVQQSRLGNFALSGGYDATFDCVGNRQSLEECLKWTRGGGQAVMVGTGHGGGGDLTSVWFKELKLFGVYGRSLESVGDRRVRTYELVHELMADGKLNLRAMLTHTFDIEGYREAFKVALDKVPYRAIKVAFDFRSG